jgi:ubiquinone/menaquinone biosynthesis C-methylase UbiE
MSHLFTSVMQAKNYALFRPQYPVALYAKVASLIRCPRSLAIDVGCGTGQASLALTEFFDSVFAIDPSASQLSNAAPHDRIRYQVGTESSLPAADATVALVTAAQAAHWFDMDQFHREVDRVLMNGGVLAIWTYGNAVFRDDPLLQQKIFEDFYSGLLKAGGYWDERREHVDDRYSRIPCCIGKNYESERIEQGFDIQRTLSPEELTGYLRSWSGYVTYCERNNIVAKSESDPVEAISKLLRSNDQYEQNGVNVTWPVTLLLSAKRI